MKQETTQTKELFTSGEWKAHKQVVKSGNYTIASCYGYPPFAENIKEAEANARLIAESKNMYELLNDIFQYDPDSFYARKALAIINRINNDQ